MANTVRIKAVPTVTGGRFCRCNKCFGTVAQDYPEGEFTKEELERLKAEPMLVVEIIPGKAKTEAKPEAGEADGQGDGKPEQNAQPKAEAKDKPTAKPAAKEGGK